MKFARILPIIIASALALTAHAQNVYSNPNTPCSGTPLVCTFSADTNLVREVAKITLTFNSGQSPSNQNANPFSESVQYGPGEGSTLSFTSSSVPVTWGYQPGGFYDASFALQLGSSQATKVQVNIGFKQITDPVLGTFWSVVGKQDAAVGADLTQAY